MQMGHLQVGPCGAAPTQPGAPASATAPAPVGNFALPWSQSRATADAAAASSAALAAQSIRPAFPSFPPYQMASQSGPTNAAQSEPQLVNAWAHAGLDPLNTGAATMQQGLSPLEQYLQTGPSSSIAQQHPEIPIQLAAQQANSLVANMMRAAAQQSPQLPG